MGKTGSRGRLGRWMLWLGLGVVAGIVLGFAAGLARPHAQTSRIEPR
jgi:uncharacterized protein involved in exopolysaccharide biosynthesis